MINCGEITYIFEGWWGRYGQNAAQIKYIFPPNLYKYCQEHWKDHASCTFIAQDNLVQDTKCFYD